MKHIGILVFLLAYHLTQGQTFDTKKIIDKADSILKSQVNDTVYKYFKYDKLSFYEYYGHSNKILWKYLADSKKTKENFIRATVYFKFTNPILEGLLIRTSVVLDSNLNYGNSLSFEQIPDFLIEEKPCNFITHDKALKIARDSTTYKEIDEIKVHLDYDTKFKKYVFVILNILTKEKEPNEKGLGEVEVFKIDAITGEILVHWKGWYGTVD